METSARNRTPDKLTASEREQLYRICDQHLATTYQVLQPQWVIGVGQFAEQRSQAALGEAVPIVRILHPSPASPASNRDWAGSVTKQLESAGVW